jgi:DNA-binding NtrC family response regulator
MMYDRTVLFVDDDEIFLKLLELNFRGEPYVKRFATSAAEALDILQREEVHVIAVDVVMPRIDGPELLRIVRRKYPDIVGVAMSTYAQPTDIMTAMDEQWIYKYIAKPWKLGEDFVAVIRDAVENYDLLSKHENVSSETRYCSDLRSVAQ